MTSLTHPLSETRRAAAVLSEAVVVRFALGVIGLHVVDDNFLQPEPGVSASDHLVSGGVPLAILAGAAAVYARMRAGFRAALALVFGVVTLWRSRRRNDRLAWRYVRRSLLGFAALFVAGVVLFPISLAYVVTHVAPASVRAPDLGAAYEDVQFRTSDGLLLKGWYVPSKNRAAVISFPGRSGTQLQARLLARHGYGVLLFDRRGEGESEGDWNVFGWQGERDLHAAATFLQARQDVDPARIGGIGRSVGGEMLIGAAAESEAFKAVVSEGGSGRSVRDDVANHGFGVRELLAYAVTGMNTAATAVFTNNLPPQALKDLAPRISPRAVFFIYGEHGQGGTEKRPNQGFYAEAGEPKQIWEVPGAQHVGGITTRPVDYERRVMAFFDRALLAG